MARYVVFYVEDNDDAAGIVDTFLNKVKSNMVPVALVPAPTLFCECGIRGGTKGRSFFKGKKYLWWVCAKCGRPTELWGTSYAAVVGSGRNLLVEEQVQPPAGYAQGE